MVSITKKEHVWKHICLSLVHSPDQSVIPIWIRGLHIVMEPLAAAPGGGGSQAWYFVGDTTGGPLVRTTGVRGLI